MAEFRLRILNPGRVMYDKPVKMVVLNTTEGEIGVLPGHEKSALLLELGEVEIYEEQQSRKSDTFVTLGGFATVDEEGVTIISEFADYSDKINTTRMELLKARMEAQQKDKDSGVNIQRAEAALRRSLVQGEHGTSTLLDDMYIE